MRAIEILDALARVSKDPEADLRRLEAVPAGERDELRSEAVRRLAAGTLPPFAALSVLPFVGVEPVVPDLVRVLRDADATVPVRATASLLLGGHSTFDLLSEMRKLDLETQRDILFEATALREDADFERHVGTPFERLALAIEDEDDEEIEDSIAELMESFLASPEAAAHDREELRAWAADLVRWGSLEHGSPMLWTEDDVEHVVTEIFPRKLTLGSAEEASTAVPSFRAFFRWASRVAPVAYALPIDNLLEEIESDFPSMMMDESRFGIAKTFFTEGTAAGFDMESEEGLHAFQEQWNREHAIAPSAPRKKMDAAKKRKARMAKLSRRKNRRRK